QTGELIAAGIERDGAFLDRYNPERDRAEFDQAWQGFAARAPTAQSYEPHYEGSAVVCGPPGAACGIHGRHSVAAQPGHHLAPCVLTSGRNVFEELGSGFTLLAFDAADSDLATTQRTAQSLRLPLKVVRDAYTNARQAYGSRWILVRPDQ